MNGLCRNYQLGVKEICVLCFPNPLVSVYESPREQPFGPSTWCREANKEWVSTTAWTGKPSLKAKVTNQGSHRSGCSVLMKQNVHRVFVRVSQPTEAFSVSSKYFTAQNPLSCTYVCIWPICHIHMYISIHVIYVIHASLYIKGNTCWERRQIGLPTLFVN